jgi:hypothetical protein
MHAIILEKLFFWVALRIDKKAIDIEIFYAELACDLFKMPVSLPDDVIAYPFQATGSMLALQPSILYCRQAAHDFAI